ncbi:MAG TPA: hypothetical protein DEA26_05745 [Oceanospirillales bacterium]|nr:hypothetical protein [Oceanospirillales bacterium]|tara:strand:+ start:3450 stop:3764 length:315 start_codon:yes stop_codon:yes gene_type:complete
MPTEDILYEADEQFHDRVELAEEAYQSVDTLYNALSLLGFMSVLGVGAMWVLQPDMDSGFARFLMFGGAALVGVSQILKRIADNRVADELARHISVPAPKQAHK